MAVFRRFRRVPRPPRRRWVPSAPPVGTGQVRPYAFPLHAGVAFRGFNLVPRPTDTGNNENWPGGVYTPTPAYFYDLMYDIGVNGSTDPGWTQWLRPQIDAMAALGANCCRIILDPTARVGTATENGPATWRGSLTAGQFAGFLDLIIRYCARKGMYFYATGAEPWALDTLTRAQILAYVSEFVGVVTASSYDTVIGVDVVQEADRSTWMTQGTNLQAVMNAARAARVKALPLTCSVSNYTSWARELPRLKAAGVDYLDLHSYLYTDAIWFEYLSPNDYDLPIVVGETGCNVNGGYFENTTAQEVTKPYSSDRRRRHYQDVFAGFANRYDVQLVCQFGVTKEWPADNQDWGIYSDAQNAAYAFTTVRQEMADAYQSTPKRVRPKDDVWTLPLTGSDTTYGAWASQSTYMLGWSQLDYSNRFTRSSNRVARAHGAFTTGVVNLFGVPSFDNYVRVRFDASLATPSSGEVNWCVSVRHQGATASVLDHDTFYFANICSKPADSAADGYLTIWRVIDGATFTQIASLATGQPFDLTKTYDFELTATGSAGTTSLTAVLTNAATGAVVGTLSTTDTNSRLQGRGLPGLPASVGAVVYSLVQCRANKDDGATLPGEPQVASASSTQVDVSWRAASGGTAPYTYTVEYAPLARGGFPGAWTALSDQSTLTASITGLTPGQKYAVRVKVTDSASPANVRYSAWAVAPRRVLLGAA